MRKCLVVLTSGDLNEIIAKGEIAENYFNIANYFQEIHIINFSKSLELTKELIMMCGTENIKIHNIQLPRNIALFSLYYNPIFLKLLLRRQIRVIKRNIGKADLVRCFGMSERAIVATELGKYLNVPTILSLHGNPDLDYFRGRRATTFKLKTIGLLSLCYEKYVMRNFTHYIGVYNAILPYFEKYRIKNYSIIYNDVSVSIRNINKENIRNINKEKRSVHQIKVTNVGRQDVLEKNPKNIIIAASKIDNVSLTVIGDGSLHEDLVDLVESLQLETRIKMIKRLPNPEVLREIASSDIYVYHSINSEVSKSCIEAALLGVPVIVNYPQNTLSTEIVDAGFLQVEDSPEGYEAGIKFIINNLSKKELFLTKTKNFCFEHWDSNVIIDQHLALYKKLEI